MEEREKEMAGNLQTPKGERDENEELLEDDGNIHQECERIKDRRGQDQWKEVWDFDRIEE